MRRILGMSVVVLAGAWLVLGTVGMSQNPSSDAKSTNSGQPAQAVLTVAPACPNMGIDAKTNKYTETEPAVVRYSPAARGAELRMPTALTLHVAPVPQGGKSVEKDIAMERQPDGTWTASFTITSQEKGSGYILFDVEDQAHRFDRNQGDYWDATVCLKDKKWGFATRTKAGTYDGHVIAPGFQRVPNQARALVIMREDFAANPQNFDDLSSIWNYETKGGIGRGSDADWAQVSREVDETVAKYRNNNNALWDVATYVAGHYARLDPAVVARVRAAVIAMPQTVTPIGFDSEGHIHEVPRTKQWDDGMAQNVNFLLSEMDLPLAQHVTDPAARGAALETFLKKYADCGNMCIELAPAYGEGVEAYGEAGDLNGAKRVAEEWMAWDPKNPDPPAVLAQTYLKANSRLSEALELTSRAAELYQPFATTVTRLSSDHSIRSQAYFVVGPYASFHGQIELLRGKIEAAMGDWAAAAKDLQVAGDALAQNGNRMSQAIEAAFALGGADEHTGAMDAALKAYLNAASAPYQKDSGPHDAYVRLFVAMAKGTAQQAEDSLLAAVREHRSTNATAYVPVELHQAMPKLELTNFSGKAVPQGRPGRTTVVDIWATWCSACALELPSLLEFQKTHPGVDVLAVDVGDKPDAVHQFLTSKHLTGLHVALTKEFPKGFAQNYPTTFVVSPKREIAFLHESLPSDMAVELEADIASLNP